MEQQKPQFRYYYGDESEQFSFFKIPKLLITHEIFRGLSNDAKILYGLLLDRMSLSQKNKWYDEENRAWLIEKRRLGQGNNTIMYVKNFLIPQEMISQQSNADIISEVQNLNFKKSKIRTSKSPKNQLLGVQNMDHNNTYNNKTNNNQTDDSNRIISGDDKRCDEESELKAYQSLIKENIEYEYLLITYPTEKETIEGIYELIVETMMTSSEKILIASNWYPASLVKSKFMKLNYHHIQYVLDMLRSNTTKVRNIKKYILASLFNAPTTIESYYRAEVNHDFPQYAAAK